MGKTRIVNLAKELKMEVRELIQRLKDDLGLQENFTYLSSLDEAIVARARQVISVATPQVEELRVGDNVKRRRRVAPPPVTPIEPPPESAPEAEVAPPPPKETAKPRKPKETVARVVSLPPKEKTAAVKAPPPLPAEEPPVTAEVTPAVTPEAPEAATAAPQDRAPGSAPDCAPGGSPQGRGRNGLGHRAEKAAGQSQEERGAGPDHQPARRETTCSGQRRPGDAARRGGAGSGIPARSEARRGQAGDARGQEYGAGGQAGGRTPAHRRPVEEKKDIKGKKKVKRPEVPDAARAKPVKKREVRERADLYGGAEGEHRGSGRRKGMKKAIKKLTKGELTVPKAIKRRVKVGESITVGELAKRMGIKSGAIIKQLLQMGMIANINYPIDFDSATIVAGEFGYEVEHASMQEEDLLAVGPRQEGVAKAAAPGGHHHGPRRPRQNFASGRDSPDPGHRRGSRRHYPAYRRLLCGAA